MSAKTFSQMPCTVARSLDLIGERWALLVLREAYFGTTRFDAFEQNLGIAPNILTARLGTLVEGGMLERVALREGGRRCEYRLTDMGRDFFTVYVALAQWGDRWLAGDTGAPVLWRDRQTDEGLAPMAVRTEDGRIVTVDALQPRPGPGATERQLKRFGPKPAPEEHDA